MLKLITIFSFLTIRRDTVLYHLTLYSPTKPENLFAYSYRGEIPKELSVPESNTNVFEYISSNYLIFLKVLYTWLLLL